MYNARFFFYKILPSVIFAMPGNCPPEKIHIPWSNILTGCEIELCEDLLLFSYLKALSIEFDDYKQGNTFNGPPSTYVVGIHAPFQDRQKTLLGFRDRVDRLLFIYLTTHSVSQKS